MKSSIEGVHRGGDTAPGGAGVLGAERVLNRNLVAVAQVRTHSKVNEAIDLRSVPFITCNSNLNLKKFKNWRQNKDISRITKTKRINHLQACVKGNTERHCFCFVFGQKKSDPRWKPALQEEVRRGGESFVAVVEPK